MHTVTVRYALEGVDCTAEIEATCWTVEDGALNVFSYKSDTDPLQTFAKDAWTHIKFNRDENFVDSEKERLTAERDQALESAEHWRMRYLSTVRW